MVLGEALGMVCGGVLIAVPLSAWGVGEFIPIAWGAFAMIGIGLVAAYLPVRRAAGVRPMEALRHE